MTAPDREPTDAELAAEFLGKYLTEDEITGGLADGSIQVHVTPVRESVCRVCFAPITLVGGEWVNDSSIADCPRGRSVVYPPHKPMGGTR